jgi:hypothetical protein
VLVTFEQVCTGRYDLGLRRSVGGICMDLFVGTFVGTSTSSPYKSTRPQTSSPYKNLTST